MDSLPSGRSNFALHRTEVNGVINGFRERFPILIQARECQILLFNSLARPIQFAWSSNEFWPKGVGHPKPKIGP